MGDEEEALSSNSNQTPNDLGPETRQRKHAAMLERLANRHQTRSRRPANSDSASSPSFESTSSFLSCFADSKSSIEARIAHCRLTPDSESNQLKPQLNNISSSISDLEKLVAENSYFLPPYDRIGLIKISDSDKGAEEI